MGSMTHGPDIPGGWRGVFDAARAKPGVDRPADIAAGEAARAAIEQLEKKYVKMPETKDGSPKFASRSDGVEAGIVDGGFVPPTLDN